METRSNTLQPERIVELRENLIHREPINAKEDDDLHRRAKAEISAWPSIEAASLYASSPGKVFDALSISEHTKGQEKINEHCV